jgi:circadian clock protein KaiB
MNEVRFTLYIAGRTPRSLKAIANLQRIGDASLGGRYQLQVIDVIENPEAAEQQRILTTPTLIKEAPLPARRVTGDLTRSTRVLSGLALDLHQAETSSESAP